jgi:hypothetical protein
MGARIQRTVEPIQLDVDWLIGKRTDPRLRLPARKRWLSRFNAILICLLAISGLLIAWPKLSSQWLAQELRLALAASSGMDESLELLVSLNELGDLSHREIVSMLGSAEPQLRHISYQWIRERIRHDVGSDEWLRGCHSLFMELVNSQFETSESMHLRSLLCTEALDEMDRLAPNASVDQVKELCRSVLAVQPLESQPSLSSSVGGVPEAGTKEDSPADLPQRNIGSSVSSRTIGGSIEVSVAPSLMDIPLPSIPEPVTGGLLTASVDSPDADSPNADSPDADSPDADSPNADSPNAKDLSDAEQRVPKGVVTISFASVSSSSSGAVTAVSHRADQIDLSGVESLSLENLFTLLSSTQERRVRMVCDELFRRGVPTEIVEIAIDMARGDSSVQLEAMEQAVRGGAINPVPLLAWMAQSQDRKVRHRAIALLGAMQDRDAHLKLRSLFQREPDKQLQQMIQQALVAGTGVTGTGFTGTGFTGTGATGTGANRGSLP